MMLKTVAETKPTIRPGLWKKSAVTTQPTSQATCGCDTLAFPLVPNCLGGSESNLLGLLGHMFQ